MPTDHYKEADIYLALDRHYTAQGYKVQGEVVGCDLVALRDDQLIIIELKKAFTVKLLYQAVRRLSITDNVYVAFLAPEKKQKMAFWSMIKSLARRLQLGVYVVDPGGRVPVKLLVEPGPFQNRIVKSKRAKVLKEINGRRVSQNAGGVTGTKLKTAYLENAIHISTLLHKYKQLSAADLKEHGTDGETTYRTLYNNHYGWFRKKDKGVYALKPGAVRTIKKEYPEIWEFYE